MKRCIKILLVASLCAFASPYAQAEKVSAALPSGVVVNADYVSGDPSQPALLVVHGFLQTREFQATKNIIDGLSYMGYEVLGPSLSLGVESRRKSLSCEAMHKHTLEDDLEELDHWVDWLLQHGHSSIVLVGHSWGGQQALAYVAKYPDRPITGVVAVSLVRTRQTQSILDTQSEQARIRLKAGEAGPDNYELNFCKKYTGTPQSYLSYAEWSDAKVLTTVKNTRPPVHVILGGDDRRIDNDWVSSLRNSGAEVSRITGADHFFSSQYEFDLLDELEKSLGTFDNLGPG
jgi:pimeloyl-ACP methyl ester carboxylesterase